jgi:hypothetical protein
VVGELEDDADGNGGNDSSSDVSSSNSNNNEDSGKIYFKSPECAILFVFDKGDDVRSGLQDVIEV